jgi:hypothetical protein
VRGPITIWRINDRHVERFPWNVVRNIDIYYTLYQFISTACVFVLDHALKVTRLSYFEDCGLQYVYFLRFSPSAIVTEHTNGPIISWSRLLLLLLLLLLLSFFIRVCMLCSFCNRPSGCWRGTLVNKNWTELNWIIRLKHIFSPSTIRYTEYERRVWLNRSRTFCSLINNIYKHQNTSHIK